MFLNFWWDFSFDYNWKRGIYRKIPCIAEDLLANQ